MSQHTTPTSGAAIQRYKIGYHSDEWGQRSSTPSGIPDASGSWVRYADHVTALAAGQATAAQALVQDDLITIRKPTTSAELLWLLKLAHLVISDVDKTLEETFAPAQPAPAAQQAGEAAESVPAVDERAAFEAQFPVPGGVHWDGTEYVVKDSHVSSYRCNRFEGQWEAWKARASHGQAPAGATLRSMIEGMSVSVDVSTGDHDAGHRYFGTVTEVMECQGDKHGVTLLVQDAEPNFTATPTAPQPVAREPQCWCLTCRPMRFEDPYSIRMALCPTCGNKRCPKANDHRNTCTGSNEPGQPGSAYFGGIKGGQHGTE